MSDEDEAHKLNVDENHGIDWTSLPIVCPHCGNHGESDGAWTSQAPVPFKLVEEVPRLWEFAASVDTDGILTITGDADSDEVDWEGGNGERFACMVCFGEFPLPADARLDFE